MLRKSCFFAAVAMAAAAGQAQGQVIITEILADPNGGDVPGEFVEIYNTTANPVDISGWYLGDEDGNWLPLGLPQGTIINGFEALIIMRSGRNCATDEFGNSIPEFADDPNQPLLTEADFHAAYGELNAAGQPYRVLSLPNCMTAAIANTGSPTNEVLTLFNELGVEIDVANYENGTNGWPATVTGVSIYLKPQFLNSSDNDSGAAWNLSVLGVDGAGGLNGVASQIVEYIRPDGSIVQMVSGGDVASPGYVETSFVFTDCNNNGIDDSLDIFFGLSGDCNGNGIPDECEPDCNNNGIPDECDIAADPDLDCNNNGILDSCEIASTPGIDSNNNGIIDECESAGEVIITEIMFDPWTSPELEYVELYNTTNKAIDISGWTLLDLEGDPPSAPFPAGTILGAGEIIVVFGAQQFFDANTQTFDESAALAQWQSLWGDGFTAIPLPVWDARANFGTLTNEILALLNENGVVIDVANYSGANSNGQAQNGWPANDGHGSIYLLGTQLNADANNDGQNWRLSIPGLDGAYQSNLVPNAPVVTRTGEDWGSPGFINFGAVESPIGDVIITEIMYTSNSFTPGGDPSDPNVGGGFDEWVEIYNRTNQAIDISGWYLADEDGFTAPLPAGSSLAAGEVAVIMGFNDDLWECENEAISEFYDAWGCGYQVFAVAGFYESDGPFGLARLANAPSDANEILRIVDASGKPQDIVNYDDDSLIWPLDGTGVIGDEAWSIFLVPPTSNYTEVRNDDGTRWGASLTGLAGGRAVNPTFVFNSQVPLYGSPGTLQGVVVANLTDCPTIEPCADCADADGNGSVDLDDLNIVLTNFGQTTSNGDLNGDGQVDLDDLNLVLTEFGTDCQ